MARRNPDAAVVDDRTAPLFDVDEHHVITEKQLVRAEHPQTSREAACAILPKLPELHRYILVLVRLYPRCTANEIADREHMRDPRKVGRRLPELEKLGRIRRCGARVCTITGKTAETWEATNEP